jgi:hypothetical protein
MMKTNAKRKNSAMKKLVPAAGMLALSASMLATSTYAWFTMNKTVTVTGMAMKAHAEDGLLINEVKLSSSNTWDESATANTTPSTVVLRPASTADMVTFWHANSKVSADEAGIDDLTKTVSDGSGNYYTNVTAGQTGIEDEVLVYPENDETEGHSIATGNVKAETHIYYKDASFGGNDSTYQDGEGFYAKYTYYIKSSGDMDLTVSNLQAQVKATKKAGDTGTSTDLEKSLRVGIAVPVSNAANAAIGGYKIFAPVAGADDSYVVTGSADGAAATRVTVNPIDAESTGTFTGYTMLNNSTGGEPPTVTNITIPDVNDNGLPVYVYVWFEGEDQNCMSDNLTEILCTYDIDINFQNAAIY